MSIPVSCQCGKRFKTGDQYAGKKTRCPGCGKPLTIPAAMPKEEDDLMSLSEAEVFQPSAAAPAPAASAKKKSALSVVPPIGKSNRGSGPVPVPHVSISPGIIVLIVLAILIPSAIYWAKEGPMKTQAKWKEISDKAGDNIVGQITRAIRHEYQNSGRDMTDMTFQPKALTADFDSLGMMITMPDSVTFQGRSTEGHFSGQFHPKTWRFEVDVPLRTSPTLLKVTGSASETDTSLDVNGKAVD